MAHFANINTLNGKVMQVVVVNNTVLLDEDGNEQESIGIDFLKKTLGYDGWIQTSYNKSFRKNFAQIGGTYDFVNDAFVAQKPYASWMLNEKFEWVPPVPYPDDGDHVYYKWDEQTKNWIAVD